MIQWTSDELNKIGAAEELQIASLRQDGTLRKPVIIWVVRVDDDLYVRCVNGRLGAWFRGNLRELFADTLLSPSAMQRGYFEPRFVRRIVDEHLDGRRDHTLRLWQLVVFERWHRQYVAAERTLLPLSAPALPSAAAFGCR